MTCTELLMKLQYEFPLTPRPLCDIADSMGRTCNSILAEAKRLIGEGIVKRIGFYLNVKTIGLKPVLVAVKPHQLESVEQVISKFKEITHAYLRDHPTLKLWVVVRVRNLNEAIELAKMLGENWVLFPSERTYKLSVKYDLYKGVSRAGPYSMVREDAPPPEAYGIPRSIARQLTRLEPVEEPYKPIAEKLGISIEEAIEKVRKMLESGTLLDPGAALDGYKLGFRSNAMTVIEYSENICKCVAEQPYTTHVVERSVYPEEARSEWGTRLCYFMVHATSRKKALAIVQNVLDSCGAKPLHVLFSIADLAPGRVR